MESDEQQIRALVATWLKAIAEGDVETVLSLIAEDAVFLIPGRAPMDKAEFAQASRAQTSPVEPKFEGKSEIKEIQISGDLAFMWTELSVSITPKEGTPITHEGHTLSVLKKQNGRWLLARDANLLSVKQLNA